MEHKMTSQKKKACQHAFGKDSVIECTNKNKYLYGMGKLMQLTMSEDNSKRTKKQNGK